MVTALILLGVERDKIPELAEQLASMDGVTEVYSVAGQFDLVAIARAKDNEALAELVTGHLLKVQGIRRSETLISFRVYSKHDLEAVFGFGAEK